jgi:hypothetical protein
LDQHSLWSVFTLLFAKPLAKLLESACPSLAIKLEPFIHLDQRFNANSAWPTLSIACPCHKTGSLEHSNVFGHSASRHSEGLGQFTN